MRQQLRQRLASWVLLAVFLPMLVLSSLHTHEESEAWQTECNECVHHQPCAGHLTDGTFALHDCVLCQFLSLPYLTAAVLGAVLFIPFHRLLQQEHLCRLTLGNRGVVALRGPPAVAFVIQ